MALNTGSALSGAGTGALYGSQFGGPIGSAVGALTGGALGLFGGSSNKKKKVSSLDSNQQQLYDQMMQAIQGQGGPLADLFAQFDPQQLMDMFQKSVAQPAYQNFQENVVPTITGQFRGQNLQNSSYLGGHLTKAGTDLQKNLDALLSQQMYQGRQQSQQDRRQGVQNIMGTQTFAYQQPHQSPIDALLASLTSGAGQMIANKFGG